MALQCGYLFSLSTALSLPVPISEAGYAFYVRNNLTQDGGVLESRRSSGGSVKSLAAKRSSS